METEMTKEEHRQRHIELHKKLDELIADFISQTNYLPSQTSIHTLMSWSFEQTKNPTTKE